MSTNQIGIFLESRPFHPFLIYLADGRTMRIIHPDFVAVGEFALGIWILYVGGEVELIDVALIISMRTEGPVDPAQFIR